ncbi:CDGSH iron-sulfur domain-containing protein [Streptomyces sp. NPDC054855]
MPNAPEPAPAGAEDRLSRDPRPRRVTIDPEGPLLVEGPVEVVAEDGSVIASRRFTTAICTCRRSRAYPWCDTSHRRRVKPEDAGRADDSDDCHRRDDSDGSSGSSGSSGNENTKGEEAPDAR